MPKALSTLLAENGIVQHTDSANLSIKSAML